MRCEKLLLINIRDCGLLIVKSVARNVHDRFCKLDTKDINSSVALSPLRCRQVPSRCFYLFVTAVSNTYVAFPQRRDVYICKSIRMQHVPRHCIYCE